MGERVGVTGESAIAPTLIGVMFGLGLGISRDIDEAKRWIGISPKREIVPKSAPWMSSLLYADRLYCEALCWLSQSAGNGLPVELVGLLEARQSAMKAKLSPDRKREVESRINGGR